MPSTTAVCDSRYLANDPLSGQPYGATELLGSGSIGEVFLAEHRESGTPCVVKIQRARLGRDPSVAERIRVRAESLARLNHPNIAAILGSGQTSDERPYIVTEYLRGQTMADELAARGQLPMLEALGYARQLLSALGAAHALGIVHRDIKPDNLFLCDGSRGNRLLKVLDFGETCAMAEALPLGPRPLATTSATGMVASALRYVSPEGVLERPVDHRSDLYSAALVLYFALAGRGPFDHIQRALLVLSAHVAEEPDPPSRFSKSAIPAELDRILLRALRKSPEQRFQSAEELREQLELVANQLRRSPSAPEMSVTEVRSSPAASQRPLEPKGPEGPLRIGARFLEKYEICEQIGRGGQAWVYHGRHIFTGREVAIKIVHSPRGMTHETLERGKAEARALGKLDHPNIVIMHDAGVTDDGLFYIVMELLRGRSLRAALAAHGHFSGEEVLELAIQAAEALEQAHQMGLIHRDLTPDNIYLTGGNRVKVVDFGIAKMLNEIGFTTHEDVVMGSILYMSPEQVQGLPLTTRSDICALGLVMFEALIGKHPSLLLFEQDLRERDQPLRRATPSDIPPIQIHRVPPLASELAPSIPTSLAQVIERAIAKDPDARFATMAEFVAAMRACQTGAGREAPVSPRFASDRDLSQRVLDEPEVMPDSQRLTPRFGLVWDGAGCPTPIPLRPDPLEITKAIGGMGATLADGRRRGSNAGRPRSRTTLRSALIGACLLCATLTSLGAVRHFETTRQVPALARPLNPENRAPAAMVASLSPALPVAIAPDGKPPASPPGELAAADVARVVAVSTLPPVPTPRSSPVSTRTVRPFAASKPVEKLADDSHLGALDRVPRVASASNAAEGPRKKLNGGKLIYGD